MFIECGIFEIRRVLLPRVGMVSFETGSFVGSLEVCLLVRRCNKRRSAGGHSDGPGLRQNKRCWESLRTGAAGGESFEAWRESLLKHGGSNSYFACRRDNFRCTAIFEHLSLTHSVQFGVLMFVVAGSVVVACGGYCSVAISQIQCWDFWIFKP